MNNKALLMTSSTKDTSDNTIDLHVDTDGTGYFGYCGVSNYGTVPHGTIYKISGEQGIPYWYGELDGRFALGILDEYSYKGVTRFGTYFASSGGFPSVGQGYTIKVTRCDTKQSIIFSGEHGSTTRSSSIALGLSDMYSKHVTLTFDPPPTDSYRNSRHLRRRGVL